MTRPLWSGSISVGLVTVPVKLMPAVKRKGVSFHQLHADDGARNQYRRSCSAEEREVPEEVVAGPEPERPPGVPGLMAALEASLARAGLGTGGDGARDRRSKSGGAEDGSGGGGRGAARRSRSRA